MFTNLLILISITASIVLGVGSNWLHDVFKAKGVIPVNPSLKRVVFLLIASVPLIGLAALPDLVKHDETISKQKSNQPNESQLNNGIQIRTVGPNSIISQHGIVTVKQLAKPNKESTALVGGNNNISRPNIAEVIPSSGMSAPLSPTSRASKPVSITSPSMLQPVAQPYILRQKVGNNNEDVKQVVGEGNKPAEAIAAPARAKQLVIPSASLQGIEQNVGDGNTGVSQVVGDNNQF